VRGPAFAHVCTPEWFLFWWRRRDRIRQSDVLSIACSRLSIWYNTCQLLATCSAPAKLSPMLSSLDPTLTVSRWLDLQHSLVRKHSLVLLLSSGAPPVKQALTLQSTTRSYMPENSLLDSLLPGRDSLKSAPDRQLTRIPPEWSPRSRRTAVGTPRGMLVLSNVS